MQAFYELEPFGDAVADQRHGVHMALIANPQRGKGTKPYTQEDFMLGSRVLEAPEPEFIDDPVAHSALIRAKVFGNRLK